jgi:CBS domain containing-hemolysin-like protein
MYENYLVVFLSMQLYCFLLSIFFFLRTVNILYFCKLYFNDICRRYCLAINKFMMIYMRFLNDTFMI